MGEDVRTGYSLERAWKARVPLFTAYQEHFMAIAATDALYSVAWNNLRILNNK